jgi:hypothetical protein
LEDVTRLDNGSWIDCDVPFVDVSNDAFLIDEEGGAIAKALVLIKNTIVLDDGAFEIAEEWEGNLDLLCKFPVGGNAVHTQTKNLRFVVFEFRDISLIRF